MNTIEGTIKLVAKTGGVILNEFEGRWFNPQKKEVDVGNGEIVLLKNLVLEELKAGQKVKFVVFPGDLFDETYEILSKAPEQPMKHTEITSKESKGLKVHGIMAGDFDSMIAQTNEFRKTHTVRSSQPYPRISNTESFMIILYYEED